MYPSFYAEFEKLAREATAPSREGEGSRGGKVVGHTKSGDPIYESKKPGFLSRHGKLLGGVLAGSAALGALAGVAARRGMGKYLKPKTVREFEDAYDTYQRAGGAGGKQRGFKASKEAWERFRSAGDAAAGGDPRWERAKRAVEDKYDFYKRYHRAAQEAESRGSAWTPPPRADWTKGPRPGTRISGLGRVKTKAEAKKAYLSQSFKSHPDRGGSASEMQDVNAEWEAFRNSPAWEKLAMVRYWSAMANALIR